MRLDLWVAERQGVSRTRAQNLIKTGGVSLNGARLDKVSTEVDPHDEIIVVDTLKYASLGGLKLENALKICEISAENKDCLDIGAANGGFTDCLLDNGARSVAALDVTISFPERLRSDPRVSLYDGVNVKDIATCFEIGSFDFITIDLSFISLCGIFGIVAPLLKKGGILMALFKPQFEVGRKALPKSGVVRDEKDIQKAFCTFCKAAEDVGLTWIADTGVPDYFPEKNKERTVFFKV